MNWLALPFFLIGVLIFRFIFDLAVGFALVAFLIPLLGGRKGHRPKSRQERSARQTRRRRSPSARAVGGSLAMSASPLAIARSCALSALSSRPSQRPPGGWATRRWHSWWFPSWFEDCPSALRLRSGSNCDPSAGFWSGWSLASSQRCQKLRHRDPIWTLSASGSDASLPADRSCSAHWCLTRCPSSCGGSRGSWSFECIAKATLTALPSAPCFTSRTTGTWSLNWSHSLGAATSTVENSAQSCGRKV